MHRITTILHAKKSSSLVRRVLLKSTLQNVRNKCRAVVFDMAGVILPSPFPVTTEYTKLKNFPERIIFRTIEEYGDKGAWPKLEIGQINSKEFGEIFSEEASKVAGKPIDLKDFLPYLVDGIKEPIPEVLEAISCLREHGIKTALLTNNWKMDDGTTILPFDRNLFDVIIESAVEGINKPKPVIYKLCLNSLNVKPEETVFLDDMAPNIKAAKAAGISTIHVDDIHVALSELENLIQVPVSSSRKGTSSVRKEMAIDSSSLTKYLNENCGMNFQHDAEIFEFSHGQSNPTYLIDYGPNTKKMVLRKKPPGKLLPSAHAVEREHRIMEAVGKHGVKVPKLITLCEDKNVIGTPFYIMELVEGNIYQKPALPGKSPEMRTLVYNAMIDNLCSIHKVNIEKAGLSDFGKQGNYVGRQVKTWSNQFLASKTHDIPAMDRLMEWLPQHLPVNERVTVVHGDYRVDNLIFRRDIPEVIGILDWELSTLGDPLSDVAYSCLPYFLPRNFPILPGLKGENLEKLGIPSHEELVQRYCSKMNLDKIENFDFYMAFSYFRVAAILQGVYKRSLQGQASSEQAKSAGKLAENIADISWTFASKEGFRLFNRGIAPPSDANQTRNYCTDAPSMQLSIDVSSLRPEVQILYKNLLKFMEENVYPLEMTFKSFYESKDKWTPHPKLEELKKKAKSLGLWNLFLPIENDKNVEYGAGLTNVEYAFLCEIMGRCTYAPEIFNCSAPDTGNMEVLSLFGTSQQKKDWLQPLLEGKIRSCFAMTEPAVASSDATNIQSSITEDGESYVLNGRKWWTSGAMDPRMKMIIFMGKTDTREAKHKQQSMVIVPSDTPGIEIIRPLTVLGFDDAPVGHAEIIFKDVRVPKENLILGEGEGFKIAQARLGPGRIHHCMRLIGSAERSLQLMKERVKSRKAFGKLLVEHDSILRDIAMSRIEIEQCRLLVLKGAHIMDTYGNKVAAKEIAMMKIVVPRTVSGIIDRAIQSFGAAGLSGDFPLAEFFAWSRVLRIADGPDEVHLMSLAKMELRE